MDSVSSIAPGLLLSMASTSNAANPLADRFISQDGSVNHDIDDGNHRDASACPGNTVPINYKGLKVEQLKAECKARKLKVGGRKGELISRLESDDSCRQVSRLFSVTHTKTVSTPRLTPARDDVPESEIDSTCVLAESTALENYFQNGLRQELNTDEAEGSEDSGSDEELNEEGLDDHGDGDLGDNVRTC